MAILHSEPSAYQYLGRYRHEQLTFMQHLEANGVKPQYDAEHYRVLYTTISLFIVLYLPGAGQDRAPVGEELMAWLNMHFIEPSSDEGDELSSQENPWEDENFWSYLTR